MTAAETAWVAGVLEGEGCFDYNRTPKYPRIRLEMTDGDVVHRVQALTGGSIRLPRNRHPSKWKDSVLLTLNGDRAVSVMRAIRPWMGERRQEKIDTLLSASQALT